MNQTQVTISKKESLQDQRKELQQMDQEIQIMKEKLAKMKVLNQLELELATYALLRQQYRSHRVRAEKQMKELDDDGRPKKKLKQEDALSNDDNNDSSDSNDSDDNSDSDDSDIK